MSVVVEFERPEFRPLNEADESTIVDHVASDKPQQPTKLVPVGDYRHELREIEAAIPAGQPCRDELEDVIIKWRWLRHVLEQLCVGQFDLEEFSNINKHENYK